MFRSGPARVDRRHLDVGVGGGVSGAGLPACFGGGFEAPLCLDSMTSLGIGALLYSKVTAVVVVVSGAVGPGDARSGCS